MRGDLALGSLSGHETQHDEVRGPELHLGKVLNGFGFVEHMTDQQRPQLLRTDSQQASGFVDGVLRLRSRKLYLHKRSSRAIQVYESLWPDCRLAAWPRPSAKAPSSLGALPEFPEAMLVMLARMSLSLNTTNKGTFLSAWLAQGSALRMVARSSCFEAWRSLSRRPPAAYGVNAERRIAASPQSTYVSPSQGPHFDSGRTRGRRTNPTSRRSGRSASWGSHRWASALGRTRDWL